MSVRRSLILLTIVALALPVASFGLQSIPAVAPATSEEENLLFHTVGYGDVEVTINAIGSIAADKNRAPEPDGSGPGGRNSG